MNSKTPLWQYIVIVIALIFVPISIWLYQKSSKPAASGRLHDEHLSPCTLNVTLPAQVLA